MPTRPLDELVHPSWVPALRPHEATLSALGEFLREEVAAGRGYLPAGQHVLRAFELPLDDVRVLIVGQDPYPTPGHPIGLSFAVAPDVQPVPRSLAKVLNRGRFSVTINKAFVEVMHGCAEPARGRGETWISPEFLQAYHRLHIAGHAHSLECWTDNQLAGGIYGVAIGGFFAGESMFHRVSDASKVALYHLVCHLRERGFELFDIQMLTPVTKALGGRNIPRTDYLARLKKAIAAPGRF